MNYLGTKSPEPRLRRGRKRRTESATGLALIVLIEMLVAPSLLLDLLLVLLLVLLLGLERDEDLRGEAGINRSCVIVENDISLVIVFVVNVDLASPMLL
jgi:hypothetical protein